MQRFAFDSYVRRALPLFPYITYSLAFSLSFFFVLHLFANRCKLSRFSLCRLLPLQWRLLRLLGARIDVQ